VASGTCILSSSLSSYEGLRLSFVVPVFVRADSREAKSMRLARKPLDGLFLFAGDLLRVASSFGGGRRTKQLGN